MSHVFSNLSYVDVDSYVYFCVFVCFSYLNESSGGTTVVTYKSLESAYVDQVS